MSLVKNFRYFNSIHKHIKDPFSIYYQNIEFKLNNLNKELNTSSQMFEDKDKYFEFKNLKNEYLKGVKFSKIYYPQDIE